MPSAISFIFDQSKILSSSNGLNPNVINNHSIQETQFEILKTNEFSNIKKKKSTNCFHLFVENSTIPMQVKM